jgi:hypothetical protein
MLKSVRKQVKGQVWDQVRVQLWVQVMSGIKSSQSRSSQGIKSWIKSGSSRDQVWVQVMDQVEIRDSSRQVKSRDQVWDQVRMSRIKSGVKSGIK